MPEVIIYGKEKLMAQLTRFSESIPIAATAGVKKIATNIRDTAKELCPVDTGSLKQSIRLQVQARPAGMVTKIGVSAGGYVTNPKTGRKVDYAAHVEYGTSRTRAQPFMRPAIHKHAKDLVREIRRLFRI